MRVGATRARAISQPADRAASATKAIPPAATPVSWSYRRKPPFSMATSSARRFKASIKRRPDRTSTPACASKQATGNRSWPGRWRASWSSADTRPELRTERQGALGLRSVCHDGKYLYPGRTAIRRAGSQPGRSLAGAWKRRISLDASRLNGIGLGQITAVASESVLVKSRLRVANGGQIELYAPDVSIASDLSARSGRIAAGNVYEGIDRDAMIPAVANASARLIVAPGVLLDVSGAWGPQGAIPRQPATWHIATADRSYCVAPRTCGSGRQRAECGFGRRNRRIRQIDRRPGRRRQRGVGSFPDGSAPAPVASASRSMARPMPMA